MPHYEPIDVGIPATAKWLDLVDFRWSANKALAEFEFRDDEKQRLRVIITCLDVRSNIQPKYERL